MNLIAQQALQRATLARKAVTADPVTEVTPVLPKPARSKKAAPAEVPKAAPVTKAKPKPKPRKASNSREADKFVIRLPDGMRAQISAASDADERSMNSFIVIAARNELAGRKEQALMMESLALLKQQLQEALAAAKGAA